MGCFIACFRSSYDGKRRMRRRRKVSPRDQTANAISQPVQASPSTLDSASVESISPVLKSRNRSEERLNLSARKRVTFDSNVRTYELDHVEDDDFLEKERNKEDVAEIPQCKSISENGSTVSSVSSYPSNHRYENCRDSDDDNDDDDEELDYADSDLDQDHVGTDGDGDDDEDEEYDNYSDDEDGSSATQVFVDEVDSCLSVCGCPGKTEPQTGARPIARDRNAGVPSVLKPVENITQWKAVKVKDTHRLNKENLTLNGAPWSCSGTEPRFRKSSFRYESRTSRPKNAAQDIAVDASLSNWLSSSEVTPPIKTSTGISGLPTPESQGSNSPKSQEDRPILGALTVEELKQFSTSPSPRRSPYRSTPDDMPIIGTVGSYSSNYIETCVK